MSTLTEKKSRNYLFPISFGFGASAGAVQAQARVNLLGYVFLRTCGKCKEKETCAWMVLKSPAKSKALQAGSSSGAECLLGMFEALFHPQHWENDQGHRCDFKFNGFCLFGFFIFWFCFCLFDFYMYRHFACVFVQPIRVWSTEPTEGLGLLELEHRQLRCRADAENGPVFLLMAEPFLQPFAFVFELRSPFVA